MRPLTAVILVRLVRGLAEAHRSDRAAVAIASWEERGEQFSGTGESAQVREDVRSERAPAPAPAGRARDCEGADGVGALERRMGREGFEVGSEVL